MKLKVTVNSLDEVGEAFRDLYTQVGDVFVLQTDDSDYKNKISEFRNTNINLQKKLDGYEGEDGELTKLRALAEKYKNIDPDKAAEAMQKMQDIQDKKLIDEGKIEELFENRIERLQSDHAAQIKAMSEALDKAAADSETYKKRLSDTLIDTSLQKAVADIANVRPGAMQDILSRGKSIWSIDEKGHPIPRREDKILYGKDGKEPLSMGEWVQNLVNEAPYLFEGSKGGGAGGSDDTSHLQKGTISANDQTALNNSIEDIANGVVKVVAP